MAKRALNDCVIFAAADFQSEIGAQPATYETRLRDDVSGTAGSSYRKVA